MAIKTDRKPVIGSNVMQQGLTRVKLFDIVTRVVPSTFFLIIVIGNIRDLFLLLDDTTGSWDQASAGRLVAMVMAKLSITCFLGLMSLLFLIRMVPIKKAEGILPRVMAVTGTFCLYVVTLCPRANLSVEDMFIATTVSLIGTALSIFALAHLGRSFSLMAEARRLVTSGPYRVVRHPLYLFETIASVGILLQFLSFYTVLIFLAYIIIQLQRMKNEESILEKVFPDYRAYRLKTARLIPGVY